MKAKHQRRKKFSYEATADFGRVEIYDEELKEFVKKQAQKQQRLEKAKAEQLKGNPPEDILIEYK